MIRPGLLTASTSKAAHFGMSVVCFWFSIVVAPFCCRSFLVFKRVFPPRSDVGYVWRRRAHPQGRNAVEESQTCAMWLAWTMRAERGKLIRKNLSAGMERRGIRPSPYFRKEPKNLGWNEIEWNEV